MDQEQRYTEGSPPAKEVRRISVTIREVYCRTALSRSDLPDIDYSLNPYRGCEHACLYCYVPNVLSIDREEWGRFVEVRRNIPAVLSKELRRKEKGVIGISTVTDPYQPVEERFKLTRLCLEQIVRFDFPVDIQTKSDLVLRDMDVIKMLSDATVGITIPTLRDDERRLLEPRAKPIDKRLSALERLSKEGIRTYAFVGPLYPSTEVEEVRDMVERFLSLGVDLIIFDTLHLKKGVWENIERNVPRDLARIYRRRLFEERSYYDVMFDEFERWCRYYGMKLEKAF
ncbi:MAG: radical SAM protein [Thermoplasmata archaeon]|nr:MAG: radical SAM protein [Thermoplasmata archaeon]